MFDDNLKRNFNPSTTFSTLGTLHPYKYSPPPPPHPSTLKPYPSPLLPNNLNLRVREIFLKIEEDFKVVFHLQGKPLCAKLIFMLFL
jgi:hypothetical protein